MHFLHSNYIIFSGHCGFKSVARMQLKGAAAKKAKSKATGKKLGDVNKQ